MAAGRPQSPGGGTSHCRSGGHPALPAATAHFILKTRAVLVTFRAKDPRHRGSLCPACISRSQEGKTPGNDDKAFFCSRCDAPGTVLRRPRTPTRLVSPELRWALLPSLLYRQNQDTGSRRCLHIHGQKWQTCHSNPKCLLLEPRA